MVTSGASMRTHLSRILPVWQACEILGWERVHRIVSCLIHLRHGSSSSTSSSSSSTTTTTTQLNVEEDIDGLVEALFYKPPSATTSGRQTTPPRQRPSSSSSSLGSSGHSTSSKSNYNNNNNNNASNIPPAHIAQAWNRWMTSKVLLLDKSTFLRFLVPTVVQPHAGPQGHMGLFDCWVYAVQGHAVTSNNNSTTTTTNMNDAHASSPAPHRPATAAGQSVILIPDVLILLAVCLAYQELRYGRATTEEEESSSSTSSSMHSQEPAKEQQKKDTDTEKKNSTQDDDKEQEDEEEYIDTNNKIHQPINNNKYNQYIHASSASTNDLIDVQEHIIVTMALMAYRIYDSYQKKGAVARDTVHRFLTDVYGEDSYKEPLAKDLLNVIFQPPPSQLRPQKMTLDNDNDDDTMMTSNSNQYSLDASWLHVTVTEADFCRRVLDTIPTQAVPNKPYILLDWMATLACNMIPPPSLPLSVQAFLETMHSRRRSLCDIYDLTDHRLYEVKRRFHSLVQSSSPAVIQGDPMSSAPSDDTTLSNHTSTTTSTTTSSGAPTTGPSAATTTTTTTTTSTPKQVITLTAFCRAVSEANDEMGHGGCLPPALADLVFRTGVSCSGDAAHSSSLSSSSSAAAATTVAAASGYFGNENDDYDDDFDDDDEDESKRPHWTLYHVLRFGCLAVRGRAVTPSDPDVSLLRFLFELFQMAPKRDRLERQHKTNHPRDSGGGGKDGDNHNGRKYTSMEKKNLLTSVQVVHMILLLTEFADFRRDADASISPELVDPGDPPKDPPSLIKEFENGSYETSTLVDMDMASFLGLLPPKVKKERLVTKTVDDKEYTYVPLRDLVDYVLKNDNNTSTKACLTFDEFCQWQKTTITNTATPNATPRVVRLTQLMTELRLVAAVIFGVPPTDATMELRLIGEIESRHKERYTQTDVSRRGPRGTIWYLIDASWLQKWAALVRKASKRENSSASKLPAASLTGGGGAGVAGSPLRDSIRDAMREIGPINNAGLLADDGGLSLRPDVRWKHDYEILPPLAWSALQGWYDGGPPIYRTVVRYITTNTPSPHSQYATNGPRLPTENELELYPFFVTVYMCDASSAGEARPFQQNYQVSRVSPVMVMLIQLCKELDVELSMARLWVMENGPDKPSSSSSLTSTTSSPLKSSSSVTSPSSGSLVEDWILNLDQNIIEQRKRRGSPASDAGGRGLTILLELKDAESGLWPRGVDGREWSFREKLHPNRRARVESDLGDGIVGLYNMGNTCYMNSSMQCLSHTPIFREYFTSKAYLRDINTTNPLGHEGRLAQVSAVLINSIWKKFGQQQHQPKRVNAPGSYALVTAPSLTPKTFKESLGKFNEHFAGNEQHDAQELMGFLLGGLSEDLNRIVDKPYIEAPDSDGRPDRELADIWWSNHLQRELSIIVALFTGQYKSLLTCRTCKYESARFEPFSFLQLPLPEDDHLSVTLVLYPLKDGRDTMKYYVRVKSDGKLQDVLLELAKILCHDEMDVWENSSECPSGAAGSAIEDSKISEDLYIERAKDLAVVDLRDGYISKIAPNSWSLLDLQNKETAELPLLHVFELEPLSKAANDSSNGTDDLARYDDDDDDGKPKYGFLAVAQRRSELISADFLHPFAHRVFGTPILLRVEQLEKLTGRALYDLVAKRLRNFVPKAAQRFLYPNSTISSSNSGDADTEKASVNSYESEPKKRRTRLPNSNRTTTDMEEVSAGPVPRYGFRLRLTSRDGRRCLTCPWFECCIGCLIPDDDAPSAVIDGDSVVVDWHFVVDLATSGFGTRSSPSDPISNQPAQIRPKPYSVPIKNHATCAAGAKRPGSGGTITLEDCLDAFAKEERIPEAYCSRCKDFRVQTKRMSLWRLPPIVIIHLKRFQFTQTMRRKLRDLVIFPVEGLDLSRIMAPDSHSRSDDAKSSSDENHADDSETAEESESSGIKDDGRAEMLYDLYGVVHHQGALSGGHYVASLKSEIDGQWRLINDAQIYEIHARDVVDSSAYILFYIRRDATKKRLEDFWDTRGEGQGVTEEDLEKMVKGRSDRCVIS